MAWHKTSRHERDYGTEWNKKRKMALERDFGLCQCEECKGRKKVANHVHHIVSRSEAKRRGWPKSRTESLTNLISLAEECHERIENRSRRTVTGEDGWPIEKT